MLPMSGAEPLRFVLEGALAGPGLQVRLLDKSGRDLATGQPGSPLPLEVRQSPFPGQEPRPELILSTPAYSCIAAPPASPADLPPNPMLWILPFVSLAFFSVGAYITWRMRRFETAVNHFGSGKLAVRITTDSGDSIGRLARAFNQMAERIELLVASHQRLCIDMAHELRSPLTRLFMAIPAARKGAPGSLDRIEMEAGRMKDLVDELIEVARAETDPTALQLDPVDLRSLLTEVADNGAMEALDRGCEIQLKLGSAKSKVMGDVDLLRRAIENILRNAVQHTPKGTRIELSCADDGDFATVKVRDWGSGVPIAELAELFRPFYRADPSSGGNTGGAGLGLAIAQRAITLNRGTVWAENSYPGLSVVIRLPRK